MTGGKNGVKNDKINIEKLNDVDGISFPEEFRELPCADLISQDT